MATIVFSHGTSADIDAAEFRGPGTHHGFDDSPDDYDMDMDQRTRFIGGRAGRIILLGDGTEVLMGQPHDEDGDVDMEDRGEAEEAEDNDLEEQVSKEDSTTANGAAIDQDRSTREETPGPSLQGRDTESAEKVEEAKSQEAETKSELPTEPKMAAATDSVDTKSAAEDLQQK